MCVPARKLAPAGYTKEDVMSETITLLLLRFRFRRIVIRLTIERR